MNNPPQLKILQGGLVEDDSQPVAKPMMRPPGEDWLRKLPNETRFVCHHKADKGSFLDMYGIAAILPEVVLLYDFSPPMGVSPFRYVLSDRFSRDRVLVSILPTPQKEGDNDEQRYLSVDEPREVHDGHEGDPADLPEE